MDAPVDSALIDLAALEAIRRVKYRYLRCVDLKLWDEMAEVFTPDATADYGSPATGQPEIDIDGATATGTWRFEDTVIATEYRVVIKGAAFYEDRYARDAGGRWRIAHTGYVRLYETMQSLDDVPSLKFTANRWAATS